MEVGKVFVESVDVGERLRRLDEKKVAALAESMKAIGLQQPISIWADDDNQPHLVAGAHRLAAAGKLKWEEIDCIFVGLDDIDRQIWEIDENLYRAELTPDEMRDHLQRRKSLWEKRKKKEVGRDVPRHHEKGFAAETAKATGLSKRQINRLLAPKPSPKVVPIDRGEPDMAGIARRLAISYTAGQLQELIDHLTDIIKERMTA